MNDANIYWLDFLLWFLPLLVGFLAFSLPLLAAWWNLRMEIKANRESTLEIFNLQERKNDARATIPEVIKILEDLSDLEQAFIFRGRFIPGLESRCPDIQFTESGDENQISIAERTNQLRLIVRRVINNCRRVVFLMPASIMPETVEVCKNLRNYWQSKEEGKKYAYEIKINAISSILQNDCDNPGLSQEIQQQYRHSCREIIDSDQKSCDMVVAELRKFHVSLEACVEKEFPTYASETFKLKSS